MRKRTPSLASGYAEINDLSDLDDSRFELESLHVHSRHASVNGDSAVEAGAEGNKHLDDADNEGPKPRLFLGVQVRALVFVHLWYAFSICLSVYNKYMFSDVGFNFKFPIITTSLHQLVQVLLSLLVLLLFKIPIASSSFTDRVRVLPAACASAADIGLGNTSLLFVTLSFYTMIKSSALGFVLLFSILFRLESPSWQLALNISIMTVGVFMMVAGETEFDLLGFLLVLGASCSSGLRWALVKILLNGSPAASASAANSAPGTVAPSTPPKGKPHPLQTILAISPGMFLILIILGGIVEGFKSFCTAELWTNNPIPLAILYLMLPGLLAFCMTWSEFELLNVTGPLSLAIAGICKEVATIFVSIIAFHDHLSLINWIGLLITTAAIGLYHFHRLRA